MLEHVTRFHLENEACPRAQLPVRLYVVIYSSEKIAGKQTDLCRAVPSHLHLWARRIAAVHHLWQAAGTPGPGQSDESII